MYACITGLFVGLVSLFTKNIWLVIIVGVGMGYIAERLIEKYVFRDHNSR